MDHTQPQVSPLRYAPVEMTKLWKTRRKSRILLDCIQILRKLKLLCICHKYYLPSTGGRSWLASLPHASIRRSDRSCSRRKVACEAHPPLQMCLTPHQERSPG